MASPMAASPGLCVVAAMVRTAWMPRRTAFSGRWTNCQAVRPNISTGVGISSTGHPSIGTSAGTALASVSSSTLRSSTPAAPSIVAWWILFSWAIRVPLSTPSMT